MATMKCKREGCEKPAAKQRVYCSRDHAPLGNYGGGNSRPTQSGKMGRSIFKAHGEVSIPCRHAEKERRKSMNQSSTQKTSEPINAKSKKIIIENTGKDLVLKEESSGEPCQAGSEPTETTDEVDSIHSLELKNYSKNLKQVQSESLTMLDSSIAKLHSLMMGVVQFRQDQKSVLTAVQCAAQIKNLMRLKLDIFKEWKEENK